MTENKQREKGVTLSKTRDSVISSIVIREWEGCNLCYCNDCVGYYNGQEGLFCYYHNSQHTAEEVAFVEKMREQNDRK